MAAASAPGPEPALFTLAIQTGSEVTIRSPRAGERGIWRVTGQANSNADDPAYDVIHIRTGRRRVIRGSRLVVVRAPIPPRSGGRPR